MKGVGVEINFRFLQGLGILFTDVMYGVRIGKWNGGMVEWWNGGMVEWWEKNGEI